MGLSVLLGVCAFFLLGACSVLPDIRDLTNICYPTHTSSLVRLGEDTRARSGELDLREEESDEFLSDYLRTTGAVGPSPLVSGNRVSLLVDGDATLVAMLKAIAAAKHHINIESYIINDDDIGRLFADSLMKKQGEGVKVNIIYDAVGSRGSSDSFFARMREHGINVVKFNPVWCTTRLNRSYLFHRTHRKMLIVDGVTAFIGGINIGNAYMHTRRQITTSQPTEYWRDTHVMIEGPATSEFQKLFLASWSAQHGPALDEDAYLPDVPKKGDQVVQVLASYPGYKNRMTYVMYLAAIAHAKRSIFLTQAYFAPDSRILDALASAAKRGVDVRIILPKNSDHFAVQEVTRSHYSMLLRAGIRIYERVGTILHAKTAVIDGVWSTIGSTNLELWSFVSTDEVNAVVLDPRFAAEMEWLFQHDLDESEEIVWKDWRYRPLLDRIGQFFFSLFHYWM